MKHISFSLTTDQIVKRTKTVTRRAGWQTLKVGDCLQAVEQGQGLKKGQSVRRLAVIRVVAVSFEPLNAITPEDVVKEGFSGWTPAEFVDMFWRTHRGCRRDSVVTRIEFEYVE